MITDYLTKPDAWYLRYATTDQAYVEAHHLLESCPEVDAVLIWPSYQNVLPLNMPARWTTFFAADLVWPNYLVVSREGYDPKIALSGNEP